VNCCYHNNQDEDCMARPRFEATAEQRRTVEAMAAYGVPEDEIARSVGERGIDPKTLRKHFRRELDIGATKANSNVAQTAYQMATSGKCPAATMFWLKCRAGWKETNVLQHSGPHGGPIEISNDQLETRITDELARIAASRAVASVPVAADARRKDETAVPVGGLEGKT
jgi:hypothetical protein